MTVTGTPVRSEFTPRAAGSARLELGLHPDRSMILVVGGSQGASGLNDAVVGALPFFAKQRPDVQWMHLTGTRDCEKVKAAYAAHRLPAIVLPFFEAMNCALAAASVVVCRAGASCLAELAAVQAAAVLVPFPAAADNHQWHNARQFEQSGAARLLEQSLASPETLSQRVVEFLDNPAACAQVRAALHNWHKPRAAVEIAEVVLRTVAEKRHGVGQVATATGASTSARHSSVLA